MRYNKIRFYDISNGPGVRLSLFAQGCKFRCKGCFNQEAQDYNLGHEWTPETHDIIINHMSSECVSGLSILGGEPLSKPNKEALRELLYGFRNIYKDDKTIWLWTGRLYEDIVKNNEWSWILKYVDVVIDGPFIEDKKDLNLKWRGSSNQRIIDVKQSLILDEIILHKEQES